MYVEFTAFKETRVLMGVWREWGWNQEIAKIFFTASKNFNLPPHSAPFDTIWIMLSSAQVMREGFELSKITLGVINLRCKAGFVWLWWYRLSERDKNKLKMEDEENEKRVLRLFFLIFCRLENSTMKSQLFLVFSVTGLCSMTFWDNTWNCARGDVMLLAIIFTTFNFFFFFLWVSMARPIASLCWSFCRSWSRPHSTLSLLVRTRKIIILVLGVECTARPSSIVKNEQHISDISPFLLWSIKFMLIDDFHNSSPRCVCCAFFLSFCLRTMAVNLCVFL